MKKIFVLVVLLASITLIQAQNAKFLKAMQKGLETIGSAQDLDGWQTAANHFERIASAEKEEWLPAYYQSFCYMNMAAAAMTQQEMEKCIAYLDKSQTALDQAKTIEPTEVEILVLQGFIYQGRIWENPQTKGAEFSPLSHQVLDQALALDPENPRAYYLKGQNVFYTPAFFGGGPETAKPLLQRASSLFTSYEAPSPIHPDWGQQQNAYLLQQAEVKN